MGGLDKLEVSIAGRPVLAWAIDGLVESPAVEKIILVTAASRVAELRARRWLPAKVVDVVMGGPRRQESVAAGLARLDALDESPSRDLGARVVLIHDGARPLASADLATRVAAAAATYGAAIPVLPVTETLKRLDGDLIVETVDRASLAAAQTPQGFRRDLLADAFRRYPAEGPVTWTDEAALLEACKIAVHAIPGETSNLKVTLPDDLMRAEAALSGRARPRFGFGSDSHPFGPGDPLALGGLEIPGAPRLHGHSDGDVALHAVADALLGAAALGDLGRLFPAGPETPEGIASRALMAEVMDRLSAAGFRPTSIDLTIVAGRPRLAGWLEAMREAIARVTGLDPAVVNVKASTGNLAGMEGAGRGISAHAVASVEQIR